MSKHYQMSAEMREELFGHAFPYDTRIETMTIYDAEREEALKYIDYLLAMQNTDEALKIVEREINLHTADRPDDGAWINSKDPFFANAEEWVPRKRVMQAAHAEWLEHLRKLLRFRAEIHTAHRRQTQ